MYLLSLVIWLALGFAPQAPATSVEGTVLRAGTEEPVEGALVTLTPASGTAKNRLTDKDGKFAFPAIAKGKYSIRVQRDGYLASPEALPSIEVLDGKSVTGLQYSLALGGSISGRILDPAGRPSADAVVTALRLTYQDGRPMLTPVKTVATNDRGEYRMFWLESGQYMIRAEKRLPAGAARAYYPGTVAANRAVKVRVSPGTEFARVDVQIRPAQTLKVSGTITSIVAAIPLATSAPQFFLVPSDSDAVFDRDFAFPNALTTPEDRAAGRFELRNVRSGSYDLFVTATDTGTPPRTFMGKTSVDVGIQDVTDASVTITPGFDMRGKVVNMPMNTPLRVELQLKGMPPNPATRGLNVPIEEDGTFVLSNVPDLPYVVSVFPLPANMYIADLRQGGFSIFDVGTLVVGGRANRDFEIVLDSNGATIRGRIPATPEQLAAGVAVALVPDERRWENSLLYKRVTASSTGAFSFSAVAPGRYTLYAFESIPPGAEHNAEYMDLFRDEGISLTVGPGDTSVAQLRLIEK